MLKLIKYELKRKYKSTLLAFIILMVIELITVLTLYKQPLLLFLTMGFTFLMMYGIPIYIFIDSSRSYSIDLTQKQGYMIFLTPIKYTQFVNTKALVSLIEYTLFESIFIAFMIINYKITYHLYPEVVSEISQVFLEGFQMMYGESIFTTKYILLYIVGFLLGWILVIITAYLAITIRKVILPNNKFGWLVSFALFIGIYMIMQTVNFAILSMFGYLKDFLMLMQTSTTPYPSAQFDYFKYMSITIAFYPLYIAVFYFFNLRLLKKKVDL